MLEHKERASESDLQSTPRNAEYDQLSVDVGKLIRTPDGSARAYSFLRRVRGSENLSSNEIATKLKDTPELAMRTMPRRKRK